MEVSGRRPRGSDDHSTGVLCDPCKGENEDENAVFYCTVCNEYLCDGCGKAHQRAKQSKSHHLWGRDSMPRKKLSSFDDTICSKHSDKPLEYYCKTHENCCCTVCATMDHKQCSLQYMEDIAKGFEKSKEYITLVKAFADFTKLLQTTKHVATKNKKDLQRVHETFVSDVKRFRAEINTMLDSLEKASLKEAQSRSDLDSKMSDSVTTTCDTMLADIQAMSSTMEKQKEYKLQRQLVISSKTAATRLKTYDNKVREITKQNVIKDYTFQPNEKIRQLLQSLNSLGLMQEGNKSGTEEETSKHVMGADKMVSSPRQSVTASRVGDIDIRHSTDTNEYCLITGGVMIDDNKLALADHCNSSVKLVNVDTNTVISCIKLSGDPSDITRVNKDQVVVTCPKDYSNGKLVILKVGKALSIMKELDIGGGCSGIVYTNNTLIVTFDGPYPESCVKIINMSGKVLKIFKTDKDGSQRFSNPMHITLSTDERTIYVSDCSIHSVTSMSLDGTVQRVYNADNLKYPCGLAVDRYGNVYIAGCWSNNIHQLSREGQLRQVLLDSTHGLDRPWMVVYCKTGHKLYISNNDGRIVSVFQLQ